MQQSITISLINHSNPELLYKCIASIYRTTQTLKPIIRVVDNATDLKLLPKFKNDFPEVEWLFNKQKLGFSANHNQILSKLETPYVLVLNDDTELHNGAIEKLLEFLENHPEAAIAGPKLVNPDGSLQASSFREFTLPTLFVNYLILPRLMSNLRTKILCSEQDPNCDSSAGWLLGACLMIRASSLKEIGYFDDILFPIANTEDVDLCKRMHKSGWSVRYIPSASVMHIGGQSMAMLSKSIKIETTRTQIAYFVKHRGNVQGMLARALVIIALLWNVLMLLQKAFRLKNNCSLLMSEIACTLIIIFRCCSTATNRSWIHVT